MTWPAFVCAVAVAVAAALAVVRGAVDEDHGPIAGLLLLYSLDPFRPAHGGPALVWSLALPAMSSGVAVAVLARSHLGSLISSTAVMAVGAVELRRSGSPASALLLASGASVVVQALSALAASGRRLALADRCALALLAGDVAALAGPLGNAARWEIQAERWDLAQWQGALVALVLCALHLAAAPPMPARHA